MLESTQLDPLSRYICVLCFFLQAQYNKYMDRTSAFLTASVEQGSAHLLPAVRIPSVLCSE